MRRQTEGESRPGVMETVVNFVAEHLGKGEQKHHDKLVEIDTEIARLCGQLDDQLIDEKKTLDQDKI